MSAERILHFGPDDRLFGLLSGTPDPRTREVLVLLNAGFMPRTGPFRLYVELARRLARAGTPVFRMDMPGVGESPMLSDMSELEALSAGMDRIATEFGCDRFVVGGICSASDVAWRLSEQDPRVSGLLLLDPVAFRGPWYWLERWREFLSRPPASWWKVLRRKLQPRQPSTAPAAGDFRDWPSLEQARSHLQALLARNARLLFVYTGSAADRFRDRRQLAWAFGPAARGDGVQLHFWPGSDHLFYLRGYREKLMDAVERWLRSP